MSETGRKLDVEDVLSSIRRLVSEEARGDNAASEKREPIPPAPQPAAEKLVLTPSLRVPEDDKPVGTSDIERRISDIENLVNAETRDAARPAAVPADASSMISALSQSMRDFAPEEPVQADTPPTAAPETVEVVDEVEVQAETTDAEWADTSDGEELANTDNPFNAESRTVTAHIVAPTDAVVAEDDEPDASFEQAADEEVNFPSDSPFARDFSVEPAPEPVFAAPDQDDEDAPDMAEAEDDPVSAMPEPDLPPEPPLRAPTIEREVFPEVTDPVDEADAPVPEDIAQDPAPQTASDFTSEIDYTADDDGGYIDEDMLREIVSEMVRSELQGELGDRITRNVRKLVRREIHRALASRDFE